MGTLVQERGLRAGETPEDWNVERPDDIAAIHRAYVEAVMDGLEKKAKAEVEGEGRKLLPRKSPGYGDLPIELSRTILTELDAPRKIGVSITDSNLLVPSKSVTAICEIC